MKDSIQIKQLSTIEEAALLDHEFSKHYRWYLHGNYYINCLEENLAGKRITLMAYCDDALAGCCHLLFHSKYPYFLENGIPEINDLNVFPDFRRKKIASKLFDRLEQIASQSSSCIGLGVGLYKDYGNAQRMYTSRGYVMDGNGLMYQNSEVKPGQSVVVDDELLVYLIKDLK